MLGSDFDVWKLAWELKRRVFAFTAISPTKSDREFCHDIRKAARSGPDLVAEGYYRFNPREFHRFLNDAKASLGEVRNQLLHAKDGRFIEDEAFREMSSRRIGPLAQRMGYRNICEAVRRSSHSLPSPTSNAGTRTRNRTPNWTTPKPDNPEPEPEP